MPSSFRHFRKRLPRSRDGVSALLLVAFVVTAAGIPVPVGNQPQKTDEPFMCATSSCGCHSAEQCWRSCCCHTLAERLVWARENNVRPPEFAIAQARTAGIDLSWLEMPVDVKLARRSRSCCDRGQPLAAHSCCERKPDAVNKTLHSCCSSAKDTQPSRSVVAWRALKCHGHSTNWLTAVPTLINVRIDFAFEDTPPIWLAPTASDVASGTLDLPPLPPPKRA